MPAQRLYVGGPLREWRRSLGHDQRQMASRLGISVSYLSQLETDMRPLSAAVAASIRGINPGLLEAVEGVEPGKRLTALTEALAEAGVRPELPGDLAKMASEWPAIAAAMIALHRSKQRATEDLRMVEETMAAETQQRPPWETVRDWFHNNQNYIEEIDRAAEEMTAGSTFDEADLAQRLGLRVTIAEYENALLARTKGDTLTINAALPRDSRRFQIAHRIAAMTFAPIIDSIVAASGLGDFEAGKLVRIGLANYGAAALMMPYETFRAAATDCRHDVDQLARRFQSSFEQVCQRLSTLQRPGSQGLPIYFCRVDMAGNITKRHSATRMQFARFGGSCPLWIVHEAVAIPDRVMVQHAETPDGVRYISMAKGLVKAAGYFRHVPRRFAVTVGCEEIHADRFVYADAIDRRAAPMPIGSSCRLCSRVDCEQRAFPPIGRPISIDPNVRRIVPYSF